MKISKLKIHNFKSVCSLEFQCEQLVVMLGPNNHGKSNIIAALEFALTTSSKPCDADFCIFGENKELWVEVTFDCLTEQESNTFKKYVQADGSICIRKSARLTDKNEMEISYNGYISEPKEWWLKSENISQLNNREEAQKTPLSTILPETGRLTKEIIAKTQADYIKENQSSLTFQESLETGPFLGQKNVAGGVLPDFYLIPAIRDLSDEAKIKSTTTFGRLLSRTIREMSEKDKRFNDLKQGLEKLVNVLNKGEGDISERPEQLENLERSLKSELTHWGVNIEIEVVPPVIDKIFELGTNLHVDDGVKTLAENKGHGLQRALIFAFIRAWANTLRTPVEEKGTEKRSRAASESVIFAIEEPELFLHPHAQRKLAQSINQIADTDDHQVFICTHSTHFVDLDKYKNICIITKSSPSEGTSIRQCNTELFQGEGLEDKKKRFHMARWINADRAEMFFARRVVFVEGETEKTVIPYVAAKRGFSGEEVSIIDCGSKHNLPLYISIANAFKLSYLVIHDEDPLPIPIPVSWDENKKREKQRTFDLNLQIQQLIDHTIGKAEVFSPDFEGMAGLSRSQSEKKGKAIAALDYLESLDPDKYPTRLSEVVNAIYS